MSRKMRVESLKNRSRFQASEDNWEDVSRRQSRYALEEIGEPTREVAGAAEMVTFVLIAFAWVAMVVIWLVMK